MILTISTAILQPPTIGLYIVVSVHVSTLVEIMVSIISKSPLIKPALCRVRLSFKRRGVVNQVMVAVEEDIFVATKIITVVGNVNRTSLEWQTLLVLLMVGFNVLMDLDGVLWQMQHLE